MAPIGKAMVGLLAALLALVALGYVSAWMHLEQCRAEVARQLAAKPVFGHDFRGSRVRLGPSAVSARVAGLFQVEAVYMVPAGMHGTLHIERFTALPWGIERSTSQVVYLV